MRKAWCLLHDTDKVSRKVGNYERDSIMAKSNLLASFGTENEKSTVDFLNADQNCSLQLCTVDTPNGPQEEPCFVFRTNDGKGSGPQIWRLSEMGENLATLQAIHDKGYEAVQTEEGYTPGPVVIRQTVSVVDDDGAAVVKFRNRNGKGSKPASIPRDEMPEVLAYLQDKVTQATSWAVSEGYLDSEGTDEDANEDITIG